MLVTKKLSLKKISSLIEKGVAKWYDEHSYSFLYRKMYRLTETDERFLNSTEIDWIRDVTMDRILNDPKLFKKYVQGKTMEDDQIAKARAEAEEFEGRGIGAKSISSFKVEPGQKKGQSTVKTNKGKMHENIVTSILEQQDLLRELDKRLDEIE